jgi:tRNA (guanine37-N1)-methyltransferase
MPMRFHVITLFPEMIEQALTHGVVGQAVSRSHIEVFTINPRRFTSGVHQSVDDKPFGGSDGMLMFGDPLVAALEELKAKGASLSHVIHLSPRGTPLTDAKVRELSRVDDIVLISSRYAGLDQRFINEFVTQEISIGDYVVSGGELPSLVLIDAIARQVPGVLGNRMSNHEESFASHGLLEEPQFTRPREWRGAHVPEALLSGDHAALEKWRKSLSILSTLKFRPDLLRDAFLIDRKVNSKDLTQALLVLESSSLEDLATCGLGDNTSREALTRSLNLLMRESKDHSKDRQ